MTIRKPFLAAALMAYLPAYVHAAPVNPFDDPFSVFPDSEPLSCVQQQETMIETFHLLSEFLREEIVNTDHVNPYFDLPDYLLQIAIEKLRFRSRGCTLEFDA